MESIHVYTKVDVILPGTCVDSAISKMSLMYNLAKAENTGSKPHNNGGGSSAGSIVFVAISSRTEKFVFRLPLSLVFTSPEPHASNGVSGEVSIT